MTSIYILIFLVGRYKVLSLMSLSHQLRSKTTSSSDVEQAFKELSLSDDSEIKTGSGIFISKVWVEAWRNCLRSLECLGKLLEVPFQFC